MEQKISFETFLFDNGEETVIDDIEFCVNRIVMFPKIRPHQLEKVVSLSIKYCKLDDFRQKLLAKSNECPVLIYRLYKQGAIRFGNRTLLESQRHLLVMLLFSERSCGF